MRRLVKTNHVLHTPIAACVQYKTMFGDIYIYILYGRLIRRVSRTISDGYGRACAETFVVDNRASPTYLQKGEISPLLCSNVIFAPLPASHCVREIAKVGVVPHELNQHFRGLTSFTFPPAYRSNTSSLTQELHSCDGSDVRRAAPAGSLLPTSQRSQRRTGRKRRLPPAWTWCAPCARNLQTRPRGRLVGTSSARFAPGVWSTNLLLAVYWTMWFLHW